MKPLYVQFKEYKAYQEFETINTTMLDCYTKQKNFSLKFYFFNNSITDAPSTGISGIAIIFKNSSNWGWILAIANGRIFSKSLNGGVWQDWKEFN